MIGFQFDPARNDVEVRALLRELLPRVMDILTVSAGILPGEPYFIEDSLDYERREAAWRASPEHDPNEIRLYARGFVTSAAVATPTILSSFDSGEPKLARLADQLPRQLDADDVYLRAYRAAQEATDPVARFVFYYALLLMMTMKNGSEKQEYVDQRILQHKPAVEMRSGKKNAETVYTSLRNDLAHAGDRRRALHDVDKEVRSRVGALGAIVREIVSQHAVSK